MMKAFKNCIAGCFKYNVNTFRPILHCHGVVTLCHSLSYIEDSFDKPPHILQFVLLEIILGNADIWLYDFPVRRILPRCQPHVFLLCIGSLHNRSVAVCP